MQPCRRLARIGKPSLELPFRHDVALFLVFLERLVEPLLVHRVAAFRRHFHGQLERESVSIVQFERRLAADDAQQGFILDGFPRNTAQAVTLDSELSAMGREIDCALLVDVAPEVIIDRLSSRRTCRACGYTGTAADAT